MTKAEELKLLEQIEHLILTAPDDSYIAMTFKGMGEVCRNNIVNDFGDIPVEDCANIRVALDAERRMHDETKRMLAEAQKMCKEALDENERLRKLSAEWEQNANDSGEMYCRVEAEIQEMCVKKDAEIQEMCVKKDAEIMRLKAEIYDLRKGCEK